MSHNQVVEQEIMDLSVVIVNYNVALLLDECLQSVKDQTSCSHEIIVVDNNSSDESVDMLREKHPDIKVIKNQTNVGFAKANNQAFREAKGRYIFMLNPDTIVLNSAVDRLVGFMDNFHEAGACGPKVLNPDWSLQRNCHHFPTVSMRLVEHLQLAKKYPSSKLFGKEFMTYWNYDEIRPVNWITGCALLLRSSILKDLGMLDEQYFMYSEETDICYRMNKAGYRVMFYPEAEIIHYWGRSVVSLDNEEIYSDSAIKYLLESKYYFFKKNYGYIWLILLEIVDIAFYISVYTKNMFRKDKKKRQARLSFASSMLSQILSLK